MTGTYDERRESGRAAERVVHAYLKNEGYDAQLCLPDNPGGDKGDINIDWPQGTTRRAIIEVKHLQQIQFTSVHDFPYANVYVENVERYNTKGYHALAYFVCDADLSHAAIVMASTRDVWQVFDFTCKRDGEQRAGFVVPKDCVAFRALRD